MRRFERRQSRGLAALLLMLALGSLPAQAAERAQTKRVEESVRELCQQVEKATGHLKDMSATVVVDYKSDKVLSNIDKRYARQYELKTAQVRFKAPDSARLEGKLGVMRFIFLSNHDYRVLKIKPIGYEKKESLKDSPQLRQDAADFGMITADLWDSFIVKLNRMEGTGNDECYVLDLTLGDGFYNLQRIWINKKQLRLTRLEKFHSDMKTVKIAYKYLDPALIQNIWVPTKIEMYSPQGELAGRTRIQDIKLNTGLDDSLFR